MTPAGTEHGGTIGDRAWFRLSPHSDCTVVTVAGEVDIESARSLERALESAVTSWAPPRLVVDLADLSFLDSSGLAVLISARNYAKARGVTLVLVNPSAFVRRLLTTTHLHTRFAIYDSVDDALAAPHPN